MGLRRTCAALVASGVWLVLAACPGDPRPDPWQFVVDPMGHEIGTWPTPEQSTDPCDGLDNDGDGEVDEGCACEQSRSCVLVAQAQCWAGQQACKPEPGIRGLVTQACGAIDDPAEALGAAIPATVELITAAPASLGPEGTLRVEARVAAPCSGIQIPYARLTVASQIPRMRVYAWARDDGQPPDTSAGDGIFTGELPMAFGPGVPAQDLEVTATAVIQQDLVEGNTVVQWLGVAGANGAGGN